MYRFLLFALVGCGLYGGDEDDVQLGADAAEGCDPEVTVPRPIFDVPGALVADPHAEVYGDDQPSPFNVRLTWPSHDPSTSIAFLWRTDLPTLASQVVLTPEGGAPVTLSGASFTFGGNADEYGLYRMHEVKVCAGLEPDTAYTYRVGGEGHWSAEHTFRTPPAPGTSDHVRVAILGDSRGGYQLFGELLAKAETHDPDFYLFTGDMVDVGHDQSEWDAWFAAAEDVITSKVVVPAHGNHELLAVNYFAAFALPGNEQWFHHRYGDLVLVSLNDTVLDMAHRSVEQVDYLDQVWEQAPDRAYRVAMHHQAIYSANSRHGSNLLLREQWARSFDQHRPHLVAAGHNHTYERTVPIRADAQVEPEQGTVYLVSGGAGAPLYTSTDESWYTQVAHPVEHYVIADFGPERVEVVARDMAGNVIDTFEIPR